MPPRPKESDDDFHERLKWLVFFRLLVTTLLLGSTIILHLNRNASPLAKPLLAIYSLIAAVFVLSFFYSLILYHVRRIVLFAYVQIAIDTFVVTLIVYMTGSFASLFSFLYLVVIIYASMLLFRRGSMVMASLCSIQYGIMIDLEYYGFLHPIGLEKNYIIIEYTIFDVLNKIVIMMVACFAVAFLSGILAEQERKTKKELHVMEEQVKRVEKMAAVGQMAAGLAHEIKNPIASMRGAIQILNEEMKSEPASQKLMQIVMREADRLNTLVGDFLLFAKPPAGRVEKVDLGRTVSEISTLFQKNSLENKMVTLVKEVIPDAFIEIDPDHLRQILWNLLLNAGESIKEEGFIEISMKRLKGSGNILLDITDSGCGIPENMLKTIFNPFMTTKQGGTGLGLSIVHRIVESYDCLLDVKSKPGRGTSFTITFRPAEG